MTDKQITIYTTTYCHYCSKAKNFLTERGLAFDEIDITENDQLRDELSKKYNWFTVPIITQNKKLIGGYQDLVSLAKNNGLDELNNP